LHRSVDLFETGETEHQIESQGRGIRWVSLSSSSRPRRDHTGGGCDDETTPASTAHLSMLHETATARRSARKRHLALVRKIRPW
jgi:hypothetical protein